MNMIDKALDLPAVGIREIDCHVTAVDKEKHQIVHTTSDGDTFVITQKKVRRSCEA